MIEGADAVAVRAFIAAATRRRERILILRYAAAGLAAALCVALFVWSRSPEGSRLWQPALGLMFAGAFTGVLAGLSRRRRAEPAAALIERHAPSSRNVVRTAAELDERSGRVPPYVAAAVAAAAARALSGLDVRRMLPGGRTAAAVAAVVGAWSLAFALMLSHPTALPAILPRTGNSGGIASVVVTVVPPGYTARETSTLRDPDELHVLAGSLLRITARAAAGGVVLETLDGRRTMTAGDDGSYAAEMIADADGFLSLENTPAAGGVAVRRLIGLSVSPDSVPRVRITAPAADLRLADGARTVDVTIEAEDDIALRTLVLSYTRVTGFGEQFTFLEGNLPLALTQSDARRWSARASWPLGGLELKRGDMVVYRAVATDRRPGALAGESDTYVIEVVGGDAAGTGGLTGDDELDRYALSQQMIVVMTQRLIARRSSLSRDEVGHEAAVLAAAQRTVRAEFVFMLGGELEDAEPVNVGLAELHEEAHALADAAMAEGGLASRGRNDLARAIQAMSHAVTLLTAADLEEALRAEQTALTFLQRAFSSSRYIMRALTQREQIDSSRRLTGALASAVPARRPYAVSPPDPRLVLLRDALAGIAALAGAAAVGDDAAARASSLARDVARIDPADVALQQVVRLLSAASAAVAADDEAVAHDLLGQAALDVAAQARARLPDAPPRGSRLELDRLRGAVVDAARAGAGR